MTAHLFRESVGDTLYTECSSREETKVTCKVKFTEFFFLSAWQNVMQVLQTSVFFFFILRRNKVIFGFQVRGWDSSWTLLSFTSSEIWFDIHPNLIEADISKHELSFWAVQLMNGSPVFILWEHIWGLNLLNHICRPTCWQTFYLISFRLFVTQFICFAAIHINCCLCLQSNLCSREWSRTKLNWQKPQNKTNWVFIYHWYKKTYG